MSFVLTYDAIAKRIDHSLLGPTLSSTELEEGCRLAVRYAVASVCIKPQAVALAARILKDSGVAVGTTIGFPHGGHATAVKVFEGRQAMSDGATELDMVINIGALRSGRDTYIKDEIAAIVAKAHAAGAIVKVILENAYLDDEQKVRGCKLAEAAGADFVKTSTGFAPTGATHEDLALMRRTVSSRVQVKAAGGVRTLEGLLEVMKLGVTRIGATQTAVILDDFKSRKAVGAGAKPATAG
jgi:deoxyribose-phosphate aldolase